MAKKKPVARSNEERIIRVWDIETIKDLMSRRTIYETNGWHEEELRDLWVQRPKDQATASFGRNWGYYVGMDEIKRYYVTQYDEQVQAEQKNLPEGAEPGTGRDEIDFGQPTIPMLAHDPSYTWCDNYPPMTARPSGPPS